MVDFTFPFCVVTHQTVAGARTHRDPGSSGGEVAQPTGERGVDPRWLREMSVGGGKGGGDVGSLHVRVERFSGDG